MAILFRHFIAVLCIFSGLYGEGGPSLGGWPRYKGEMLLVPRTLPRMYRCFMSHCGIAQKILLGSLLLVVISLTHWGRVTHIFVSKLTIIGSDNGLSPERRQAIIWTSAGILLIGPLGTNFNEILIEIQTFSLKKMRLKMSSAKCCPFRLGLNVLMNAEIRAWISDYIHIQVRV